MWNDGQTVEIAFLRGKKIDDHHGFAGRRRNRLPTAEKKQRKAPSAAKTKQPIKQYSTYILHKIHLCSKLKLVTDRLPVVVVFASLSEAG